MRDGCIMSGEPTQTGLPADSPSLSLAERYGSFAEYAASTEVTPRAVSTSLDVARFHAFTGELTFSTDPAVRLYLDGGTVYHAEREGDPAISQILRETGVVEADQLERGLVRVGDVEHLGRLFDREPSIDRDAVMVVMETRTEAIVHDLANRVTTSVSVSAYRHHPSGLHRWFVVSTDRAESHRPVSAVAQVDRSVVDELPALRAAPSTVEIEWSEPDSSSALPIPPALPDGPVAETAPPTPLSEFHIVWPDGTADEAITGGPADAVAEPADTLPPPDGVAELPAPDPSFSIAPLEVDALPEPDAAVPHDVATAVKRALQAIEGASTGRVSVPELAVSEIALPDIDMPDAAPESAPDVAPRAAPSTPVAPAAPPPDSPQPRPQPQPQWQPQPQPQPQPQGFAPPTPDMRAEAVYARAVAAARSETTDQVDPAPEGTAGSMVEAHDQQQPGRAPVVIVDDEPEPAGERRGALRRLIDSLRHKDD